MYGVVFRVVKRIRRGQHGPGPAEPTVAALQPDRRPLWTRPLPRLVSVVEEAEEAWEDAAGEEAREIVDGEEFDDIELESEAEVLSASWILV